MNHRNIYRNDEPPEYYEVYDDTEEDEEPPEEGDDYIHDSEIQDAENAWENRHEK